MFFHLKQKWWDFLLFLINIGRKKQNEITIINASTVSNPIYKTSIPVGSTSLASFIASDVAISWCAGEIANMMQFGFTT